MSSPISSLQKVGEAKLEIIFWDIYFSELYSADGTYQPQTYPIALNIRYLRDIKAADLVEQTIKEWKKLGISKDKYEKWLPFLTETWPNIKDGDELLFKVNAEKMGEFFFNGNSIGQLEDPEFSEQFLAIWLDENCSYPKVRKRLIGQS